MLLKHTLYALLGVLCLDLAGYDIRLTTSGPAEKTAAREMENYCTRLTGKKKDGKAPVFTIGIDKKLSSEEWQIVSVPGGVRLTGGDGAGVLYAIWHYLEDHCGVRWWTFDAEKVPVLKNLPVKALNRKGKPAFAIRALYESYGNDKGRFASQMRINQDAWFKIGPEYGGRKIIDGPYFVHAITMYLPSARHFTKHPDWYAMVNGKRLEGLYKPGMHSQAYQMCLTNKELRQEFKKTLKAFIEKSRAKARAEGAPMPLVYDISQADTQQYCRCPDCNKAAEKLGGQSGLMLDFANDVSDAMAKDHPELLFNVCAYQYTQEIPKNPKVVPGKNVLVTLSDTLSNNIYPITHKSNSDFLKKLKAWSAISKNLRIWDYATTYRIPKGLPYANEINFKADLRLHRSMNVKALQYEIQDLVLSDCRDYKFYLLAKLMENPDADTAQLSREFAEGYYGKAGKVFLEYRKLIADAQNTIRPNINMYPTALAFVHLNSEVLANALKLLDKGEKLLAGDTVKCRRWHLVRLSVNRAILARKRSLMLDHIRKNGSLKTFPFDMQKIAQETEKLFKEQLDHRVPKGTPAYKAIHLAMTTEVRDGKKAIPEKLLIPPKKFAHIPPENLFDFTPDIAQCYLQLFKLVEDPEAETGVVRRLEFNGDPRIGQFKEYQKKLVWGICADSINRYWAAAGYYGFKPGAYRWYKLGECRLSADALFYFPWNWFIQINVGEAFDPNNEDGKFEVWANFKFTGSIIKGGRKEEPASISFQRLILIKKTDSPSASSPKNNQKTRKDPMLKKALFSAAASLSAVVSAGAVYNWNFDNFSKTPAGKDVFFPFKNAEGNRSVFYGHPAPGKGVEKSTALACMGKRGQFAYVPLNKKEFAIELKFQLTAGVDQKEGNGILAFSADSKKTRRMYIKLTPDKRIEAVLQCCDARKKPVKEFKIVSDPVALENNRFYTLRFSTVSGGKAALMLDGKVIAAGDKAMGMNDIAVSEAKPFNVLYLGFFPFKDEHIRQALRGYVDNIRIWQK